MKKSIGPQTMVFPTPVVVVGSYSEQGHPNAMTAAWVGICSSQPPSVAVSIRASRQTYTNIMAQQAFTLSVLSETSAAVADYFGIASGKTIDKFKAAGLTPEKSTLVNAPFIQESPLVMECRLLHHYDLGAHTQFVGEILDVKAEAGVLGDNHHPDMEKARPFIFGTDAGQTVYFAIGRKIGPAFSMGKTVKSVPRGE